jgi:beta-glucanase (GH16 family)
MTKFLALMLLTAVACSSNKSEEQGGSEIGPEPVFVEEFDTFDSSIWTKEIHSPGWVNRELQAYDAAHVSVGTDNGKSVLILTAERKEGQIFSGRINSQGKKSFKYGRIEASIKLPKTANGLWPAFWLMGDTGEGWPMCGEIDILEAGEQGGIKQGTTETYVNTAIHYGRTVAAHQQSYHAANFTHSLQDGGYHTWAMDWDENYLTIYIDDVKFHSFNIGTASGRHDYFHHNFYMLFNLAVGGEFTGIYDINGITALGEGQKVQMCVDWVKIYQPNKP